MQPENKSKPKAPRWRRNARWALILLVGGSVLALLLLNLFLATPIGKGLVAKKLSGAMRMPVKVGSATYTPWGGVRLKDIRVEQVAAARAIVPDPFFEAAAFEVDVRLFSLLGEEVVVDRLVCRSPKVSLVHGQEVVAGNAATAPGKKPPPVPQGERPSKPAPEAGSQPPPRVQETARRREEKGRRKLAIGELEIVGGEFGVSSPDGAEILRFEGLRLVADLSATDQPGRLTLDRAVIYGLLEATEIASPVKIDAQNNWALTELFAQCEGGAIRGTIDLNRRGVGMPFEAELSAQGIEIPDLFAGSEFGFSSGKAAGVVQLSGHVRALTSIRGKGRVRIDSAKLRSREEFEKLRGALETGAAGEVILDPVEAEFAIRHGVLGLREASIGSGSVLLKSVGGVRLDGRLNVATRIYLGSGLHSAVQAKGARPDRTTLEFERLEGTDWYYRDELVTGTLKDPRVDFWRTGTAIPFAQVMRELNVDTASAEDTIGTGSR